MLKLLLFKNYPIELTIYYMLKLLLKIIGLFTDSVHGLENKLRVESLIKANPLNNSIKKIRLNSVIFYFRGSDYMEFLTIISPVYDKTWAAFVLSRVNKLKPNIFIDVGAHLGTFALRVGKMLPNSTIIAIEPTPVTAYLLNRAVADNGLNNVKVLNKAAFSSSETITLDDVIRNYKVGKPIVLKIDAEGAEWDILTGAEKLLQECDECFIEIHKPAKQIEIGYCGCEICGYLREKEFSVKTVVLERKSHSVHGVRNKLE